MTILQWEAGCGAELWWFIFATIFGRLNKTVITLTCCGWPANRTVHLSVSQKIVAAKKQAAQLASCRSLPNSPSHSGASTPVSAPLLGQVVLLSFWQCNIHFTVIQVYMVLIWCDYRVTGEIQDGSDLSKHLAHMQCQHHTRRMLDSLTNPISDCTSVEHSSGMLW